MIPEHLVSALWPVFREAWILHEDEDLIVVDKPAGISTHAPEPDRIDDVYTRLREFLRARGDKEAYLGIHQRLDRDTSGVLLFTRRREANGAVARQFEGRTVQKTYIAAVAGARLRALEPRGTLRHLLVPAEDGAMRALPAEGAKGRAPSARPKGGAPSAGPKGGVLAVTHYRVIERRDDRALIELRPETGRTHQLRVQLAAIGLPIAGDPLYGAEGGGDDARGKAAPAGHAGEAPARLLLHAAELALVHPASGVRATFRSKLPDAFGAFVHATGKAGDPLAGGVDAIERALRDAAEKRYGVARAGDTTALRLAHGAGDGLPGVSVDLYGEHLVVSLFGEAEGEQAAALREATLDAAHRLGAKGVYLKMRPKHASVIVDPRRDQFAPREAVRGESAPEAFTVLELGLPFQVRLGEGLSTGIFLDQRENRRRVRELSGGARVLNLFGYTGPFTVAAAVGGARESVTVDVARSALAWARENLEAVGEGPPSHVLVEADVFPWLKASAQAGQRFDLVIVDPPSFATTKKSRFSAASDFRALAALAFGVLAPGGRMLACTNHRGIARAKLRRHLHEAAREAGCHVVQMKDLPDPVDFPPEPGAEPHLKSVLITTGTAPAPRAQLASRTSRSAAAAPSNAARPRAKRSRGAR